MRVTKISANWFYAATIGFSAVLGVWFVYTYASYTEILRSEKLTSCTNNVLKFHLQVPKGRQFIFELSMPETQNNGTNSSHAFAGHIKIQNGLSPTVSFPISSELAQGSDWIQEPGMRPEWALTGPSNTNCFNLSALIHPQEAYDIEVVFDKAPPATASLWLCWLQAYKDRNK
jgi:hypothetical protein